MSIVRVRFTKRFGVYNETEEAGFSPEKAAELVNGQVAVLISGELPREDEVKGLKDDGSATLTKPLDPSATPAAPVTGGLPPVIAPPVKKG